METDLLTLFGLAHWRYYVLTIMVLKTDIAALRVNTMRDDALVPKVARASAGMILAV